MYIGRVLMMMMAWVLIAFSSGHASIVYLSYADDGDGVLRCLPYEWTGSTTNLSIGVAGDQYGEVGHLLVTINTDTPVDPTLKINNTIDNDTSYAWTSYQVDVFMNKPFTITNASVSATPNDWIVNSLTQPIGVGSNYMGQIVYSAGTPVEIGDSLTFGYWVTFSGGTSYSLTQQVSAIPEPSPLALVMGTGLLIGGIVTYRRHRASVAA